MVLWEVCRSHCCHFDFVVVVSLVSFNLFLVLLIFIIFLVDLVGVRGLLIHENPQDPISRAHKEHVAGARMPIFVEGQPLVLSCLNLD